MSDESNKIPRILTEYTLRLLIKQNKIPTISVGNRKLINLEKLIIFLNS